MMEITRKNEKGDIISREVLLTPDEFIDEMVRKIKKEIPNAKILSKITKEFPVEALFLRKLFWKAHHEPEFEIDLIDEYNNIMERVEEKKNKI